ncbi:hypothetical protein [Pedobacter sp. GR22-6]|uniref:hypothetical protein n=1 Tax=Pedobacter sp. GR22-6 TaxID=3127957 RepID=UPI00307EA80C
MRMIGMTVRYWGLYVLEGLKKEHLLVGLLIFGMAFLPVSMDDPEQTVMYILRQMLPLVLVALMAYVLLLVLVYWLIKRLFEALGLAGLKALGLQIKELPVCQRLGFYYACFAILLFAGLGSLAAVL